MAWDASRVLRALPLMATLAALPATRAGAAEPRPVLDLDRIAQRDGRWVAPLSTGGDAQLTLDTELQRAASKILAGANPVRGGMVAIDARSGKILAWAESARDGRHHRVLTTARVPAASVTIRGRARRARERAQLILFHLTGLRDPAKILAGAQEQLRGFSRLLK